MLGGRSSYLRRMAAFFGDGWEAHAPLVVGRCATEHVLGFPAEGGSAGPRYRIRSVDVSLDATCACFIVPRGREHEYVFADDEGLGQVAASAGCGRLLAVSLLRGHAFGDLPAVQAELEAAVLSLAPPGCVGRISFSTVGDADLGSRVERAAGETDSGDAYFVEDVAEGDETVRRLVFASNDRVVQTEVALVREESTERRSGGRRRGGKKKTTQTRRRAPSLRVDAGALRSAYHVAMVAAAACANRADDAVLVGLGGGALATALRRLSPETRVRVRELDGAIAAVAAEWFGFDARDPRTDVVVGDGLLAFDGEPEGAADVVAIDVDAKDASLGMCCPPAAFVDVAYLEKARRHLRPGGVLVVNVVARARADYAATVANVRAAFGNVAAIRPTPDDVNAVLVAVAGAAAVDAARGRARIADWLLAAKTPDDPNGLLDMLAKLDVAAA